jgi:hypothetical protein
MAAYTYAYTGIGNPSTVRRSDGLEFPQVPGTVEYQQWQAYTAAGGVTAPPAAIAIEDYQFRGNAIVNDRASDARRAAQNLLVPEDLGNMLRFAEAEDSYRDVTPTEGEYPLLVAEKPWNGGTLAGVTLTVYQESYALRVRLGYIEHVRRVALQGIADSTTPEGVLAVIAGLDFSGPRILTPAPAVLRLSPNAPVLDKGTKTLTPSVQTLTLTPPANTLNGPATGAPAGIAVDHDGNPEAGAFWLSNNFLNPLTHSFIIGGWVRLDGACGSSGNNQGHVVFAIPRDSANYDNQSGFTLYCGASKGSSPFSMLGEVSNNATWNDATVGPFTTGTNYYVAMVWDAVAMNATWYWRADGEGTMHSATAGSALTTFSGGSMDGLWLATDNGGVIERGSHLSMRNWRAWKVLGVSTLGSTELMAESHSPTPVITANLHANYPLGSHTDLEDTSGNGRDLTLIGSVTDANMDPADLHV